MFLIRLILIFIIGATLPAWADTPSDFFDGLHALQADFTQSVFDETGQELERSSGQMYMQRPGKFRWEYREPYSQLIVADGERVWLYDRDLEQITVRRIGVALSSAPLAMLGDEVPLATAFTITALGQRDGLDWFRLQPKQQDSEVTFIRLGFKGSVLHTIEAEDSLRRLTRLELSQTQRDPKLAADLFTFTPPPGVDVIGDS